MEYQIIGNIENYGTDQIDYLISIPDFNDVSEMRQFEMKKFQNILGSEKSNLLDKKEFLEIQNTNAEKN